MTEKKKAAGVIIIDRVSDRMLLVQRHPHKSIPFGWAVPGGKIEETDVDEMDGARREVLEEVGLYLPREELAPSYVDLETSEGYEFHYFIWRGDVDMDNIRIDTHHVGFGWFPVAAILTDKVEGCFVNKLALRGGD